MNYFPLTKILFIILCLICLFLIYQGLQTGLKTFDVKEKRKINLRFISAIIVWVITLTVLSVSGFFYEFSMFPPRVVIVLIIPLLTIIFLTFSKSLTVILSGIPAQWLVYIQSFRIVVEILLWMLFMDNLLPVQMTFEGRNWDILVGITAPFIGYLCFHGNRYRRNLAIVWNVLGLLLLLNILIIAVLSMPTSIRLFMNEPANTIVATFPFVFLPGILVPVAYTMHIFSLKQLIGNGKDQLK